MTNSSDAENINPNEDSSWRVLGYTDEGAEIAEDAAGRRWITEPLFPPVVGEVSFSDTDLEDFLADPANYQRVPAVPLDLRDGRRWTLTQLSVYLRVDAGVAASLAEAVGVYGEELEHRHVTEILRLGWIEQEGPPLFPEDLTAGMIDHIWADPETANRLLEIDPEVFATLLRRAVEGKGFPCAVVVDLPGAGLRVDVTETRVSLWLGGLHLRRILASSEASARLAILEDLSLP